MISLLQQAAAPQQPETKSVIVNALCDTIPLVEEAMSEIEPGDNEVNKKRTDLIEKLRKELLALFELQKKVPQMRSNLEHESSKEEAGQLSIIMQASPQSFDGSNIFRHSPVYRPS